MIFPSFCPIIVSNGSSFIDNFLSRSYTIIVYNMWINPTMTHNWCWIRNDKKVYETGSTGCNKHDQNN